MALQLYKETVSGTLQSFNAPYYIKEDTASTIDYQEAIELAIQTFEDDWEAEPTDYDLDELSATAVRIVVIYNVSSPAPLDDQEPGTIRNRFQFIAQPKFMMIALDTVQVLPSGYTNNANWINVQLEGGEARVLGMSVPPPPVTHIKEYVFDGEISDAYSRTLSGIVGRVSSDEFFGYPAGELFLASAVGQSVSNGRSSIAFGFSHATQQSITYGSLGSLNVKPHHIHWGLYGQKKATIDVPGGSNETVFLPDPLACFSQCVFETAAFSGLALPDAPAARRPVRILSTNDSEFISDNNEFLPVQSPSQPIPGP